MDNWIYRNRYHIYGTLLGLSLVWGDALVNLIASDVRERMDEPAAYARVERAAQEECVADPECESVTDAVARAERQMDRRDVWRKLGDGREQWDWREERE